MSQLAGAEKSGPSLLSSYLLGCGAPASGVASGLGRRSLWSTWQGKGLRDEWPPLQWEFGVAPRRSGWRAKCQSVRRLRVSWVGVSNALCGKRIQIQPTLRRDQDGNGGSGIGRGENDKQGRGQASNQGDSSLAPWADVHQFPASV